MSQSYPRHIHFESVPNFRDLGGYRTHDGRSVAWRGVFRPRRSREGIGEDDRRIFAWAAPA